MDNFGRHRLTAVAETYADALVEQLDPQGRHAVRSVRKQTSVRADRIVALGTSVGWTQPGEDGTGKVSVMVSRNAGGNSWDCGEAGWTCADQIAPGPGATARSATHDGELAVQVARPDGGFVTITTSRLDANNGLQPISGVDLTADQLARAALDPRLAVPDVAPAPVDPLKAGGHPQESDDIVLQLGQQLMFAPTEGETASLAGGGDEGHGDYNFLYTELWTGPDGRGQLTWYPDDDPSLELNATCKRQYYRRCVVRTAAGRDIFIGYRAHGWTIYAPGPVRTVGGYFKGTGYPIDRAIAFMLDPRLQETSSSADGD